MSRKWINFFTDAGIPSTAAATYALIFSENRISENMLLDLDREVLKEMGIQTMGDVISILKHARYVYEKTARDTVLQSSSKEKIEKSVKKTLVSTVSVPENDPYFYSPASELKKTSEEKKVPPKAGPVLPPNMKLTSKVSSTSSGHQSSDNGSSEKSSKESRVLKRKIKTSVQKGVLVKEETDDSDSSSSSSGSSLECVSKYRKVMPEPSSSTTSSVRTATAKPFCFSGTKRTVSILDKEPEIIPKSGTTFTITMSRASATPVKTTETVKKSVFSRLDSKIGSGTFEGTALQNEMEYSKAQEESFPFDDNGLQPTVEIINDLYTPAEEPYIKSDGRVLHEPVARVKPIIQTEGILGNALLKSKSNHRERLGVTNSSAYSTHPSSNLYDVYDTVSASYISQSDGMRNTNEGILDDTGFFSNGTHSKKVHFAEILEKKVSIPSMDYETMDKPSIKNRISFNQAAVRVGGIQKPGLKSHLTPKERISMNLVSPIQRKVGSANGTSVKNRISLKPSVRERISLKSPAPVRERISLKSLAPVRERISLKSVPSVRQRIGVKPSPSVKDRISLKPTTFVRERISLKPSDSVRERISVKPTALMRDRISLKSAPPVRERISLKPTESARERISLKGSALGRDRIRLTSDPREVNSSIRSNVMNVKPFVKDRVAHRGVPLAKPRIAHKGVPPVQARLGNKSNVISVPKKLISINNSQTSKTSSVFSRLG